MAIRREALVGAARVIDAAHRQASALSGKPHYVVATVGRIEITPNAANAVPGRAELMLEVRSDSDAVLDSFPETLMDGLAAQLAELRLSAAVAPVSRAHPTACSPLV